MKPLFTLAKSDITSSNELRIKSAIEQLDLLQKRAEELNKKDKLASFKLAVDGHQIMDIFELKTGVKVGMVKDYLEDMVMEGVVVNKKRAMTKYLQENREEILKKVLKEDV